MEALTIEELEEELERLKEHPAYRDIHPKDIEIALDTLRDRGGITPRPEAVPWKKVKGPFSRRP